MNLPRDVFEVLSWQNVCHFKLLKIIDIYIVKNVVSNNCILTVEKTVNYNIKQIQPDHGNFLATQ